MDKLPPCSQRFPVTRDLEVSVPAADDQRVSSSFIVVLVLDLLTGFMSPSKEDVAQVSAMSQRPSDPSSALAALSLHLC